VCSDHSRGFCLKARESQCGERQYHQSISSGVQYVTLQKYFSHPHLFSYLLSSNSTYKTKNGMQIGGRSLMATQLDQSNVLANQH